ncbi:MAG: hypothetical protein ABI977_03855, partial [Acidobacteriota bacterium]
MTFIRLFSILLLTALLAAGCGKQNNSATAPADAPAKTGAEAKAEPKNPNLLTLSVEAIKLARFQFAEAAEVQLT